MSIKALKAIIENQNFRGSFSNEPEMVITELSQAQANTLYENIDCGLSPENLHCDGEISRSQAESKYREYMGAVRQLQNMGFPIPDECYEISE